jgi:hypothetical protein
VLQKVLQNGTKNYSIADIDPDYEKLEVGAYTKIGTSSYYTTDVDIPNAQSMYVLSLLTQSGTIGNDKYTGNVLAVKSSDSYGGYKMMRHASYDYVGTSNNSDYNAYFAPSQVNPIEDEGSRYALRFSIYNQQINNIQQQYDKKIEDGELTSSVFNADNNKISGTKYMGQIDENMQGIVVVFKVNDKTVVMQTDAMVYQQDFETLLTKLRRNS